MANLFTSVQDLVLDALWLAGEASTDPTNLFYQRAVDYVNSTYVTLIAGGTLGDRTLPAIDWWWARSPRRGQFLAQTAYNTPPNTENNTVTVTNGSSVVTLQPNATTHNFVNQFLVINSFTDQVARVVGQNGNTLTIDQPWQGPAQTTASYFIPVLDYPLPGDFLRFTGPLVMGRWPYEIPVTETSAMEHIWPRGQLFAGTPEIAALVTMNPPTVRLNRFLIDNNVVMEFEYISRPLTLFVGGPDPEVPFMHRRILSLGAGYQLLVDKIDARSNQIFGQFITAWEGMQSDHAKQVDNANYARLLVRPARILGAKQLLRTTSGVIIG